MLLNSKSAMQKRAAQQLKESRDRVIVCQIYVSIRVAGIYNCFFCASIYWFFDYDFSVFVMQTILGSCLVICEGALTGKYYKSTRSLQHVSNTDGTTEKCNDLLSVTSGCTGSASLQARRRTGSRA